MIDFEVGDIDFWVAFDGGKPFPVTIYRNNGTWCHHAYPNGTLSDKQRIELEGFVKERTRDMMDMWKSNMTTRLRWDITTIGKKKR